MKYGYIKDNVILAGEVINEQWQGNVYYNKDGTRKTAEQIIEEMQLKEIITPTDFDGNTTHYNFVERDGKIILAGLKSEVITEKEKQADISRISTLKQALKDSDYKVVKCMECSLNGLETPYNAVELQAERQAYREEINLLENKWRLWKD